MPGAQIGDAPWAGCGSTNLRPSVSVVAYDLEERRAARGSRAGRGTSSTILSTSGTVQPGGRLEVGVGRRRSTSRRSRRARAGRRGGSELSAARVRPRRRVALGRFSAASAAASAAPSSRSRDAEPKRVEPVAPEHLAHDQRAGDDHRRAFGSRPGTRRGARRAGATRAASSAVDRVEASATSVPASTPSWPTVPATPIARRRLERRQQLPDGGCRGSAPRRRAGRRAGSARSGAPSRCRGSCGTRRSISSVEPPPTSSSSVPASSAPTPRSVSSASSSPESRRVRKPYDHSTSPRNASPFSASRTALVATASVRSAPSASSSRRNSASVFRTRAIGSGRRRRRASTPSPRRVTTLRRTTSSTLTVVDVRDQQPRRVRAEIDGGDARHFCGITRRSPRRACSHLGDGRLQHRELASDACSLAVAAVSRSVPSESATARSLRQLRRRCHDRERRGDSAVEAT